MELSGHELERLRAAAATATGLTLAEWRPRELSEFVRGRLDDTKRSFGAWLALLAGPAGEEERARLVDRFTIGETYFFRDPPQLELVVQHAFEARRRASPGRRIRILSAGCASGEEPYSLAMLLRERGHRRASFEVLGMDLNAAFIARARRGVYGRWSLRATPPELAARYFERLDEGVYRVVEDVRRDVRFACADIRSLRSQEEASVDIAICRNVLMYLSPAATDAALAALKRVLVQGGFLFVSHAEVARIRTAGLLPVSEGGRYFFQRAEPPPHLLRRPGLRRKAEHERPTRSPRLSDVARARHAPRSEPEPVERLRGLFRAERYDEVIDALRGVPEDRRAPEACALLAAALAARGRLEEAERECERLLARRFDSAEALHQIAVCREHRGDVAAAMKADAEDTYLRPDFALAHLHLGRLARRTGALREARRQLAVAEKLLPRERQDRLELYGGGFSREALADLARAELGQLGGPR
ncbi:MAG: CheR family methyltransferase [Myxococcales bacterium]